SAPYTMPIRERIPITLTMVGFFAESGKSGSEKRRNPYVPIFSSTLASTTLPAVGASVCASGSQVWNGNIGTFTANPTKNAQNTHHRCQHHQQQAQAVDSQVIARAHFRNPRRLLHELHVLVGIEIEHQRQ